MVRNKQTKSLKIQKFDIKLPHSHRFLNGWVAIRCISASDLANVIRRVATTSMFFESQDSLKFYLYIHGIQCAYIYYVEKDNHWQSTCYSFGTMASHHLI